MTFWDFAGQHPIALTIMVIVICDAVIQVARAAFR